MIRRHSEEDRTLGNLLAVIGLLGLLAIVVADWFAGETVRLGVRQGDGQIKTICVDYGWSGVRYFEWMERGRIDGR